jgi:hypothetical protein
MVSMTDLFVAVDVELDVEDKVYPTVEQFGPLRHFEREMRCACRGCGSSTFYKVNGIPRCMTHALRELNLMLFDLGVKGGETKSQD